MDKYLLLNRSYLQPQGMDNVKLTVSKAVKDTEHNPMFTEGFFLNPPLKWEVRYDNAYPNVIYDPKYKIYRLYYTIISKDDDSSSTSKEERAHKNYRPSSTRITSLAYAESEDGKTWVKPSLGLVEFEGSKDNNMIFKFAHGTGVMLDEEESDLSRRYKLVTKVEYPGGGNFMAVSFSEDGIHWSNLIKWPKFNPAADSHNLPFRDKIDGLYKVITRIWIDGVRISAMCYSRDFINWSAPMEIIRGNGYESQVYSMPVFWYDGVYLGLASMFHDGDRSDKDFDTVDLELTIGTTASRFDRIAPEQYIIERGEGRYPTGEFDCGCIYAAPPVPMGDDLCIYYMGGNGQHTNYRETSFGRAFIKKDKFAYYEQKDYSREGILTSYIFSAYGDRFSALADIEDGGYIAMEVRPTYRDAPFSGFSFEDCKLEKGEDGYINVSWSKPLTSLENAQLCFVVKFMKARIYAFKGDIYHQNKRNYEGAALLF